MHECHADAPQCRIDGTRLLDRPRPAQRLLCAALAVSVMTCGGRGKILPVASGEDAPGIQPELYGAGLFSTGFWDYFMAWSPDQRDVLFCRATDDFTTFAIFETRLAPDGHWTAPTHPAFATRWSNSDPHVSIDGSRVFFIS